MKWVQSVDIGRGHAPNRIVFPALSPNWADEHGCVTPALEYFYDAVGKGAVGMVVVAGTAVSPEGRGSDRTLCLYENFHVTGIRRLFDILNAYGAYTAIQLMHAGGQANPAVTGQTPLSPSGVACRSLDNRPREIPYDKIAKVRADFVQAARWAYQAGAHAVELHLAHGYLLHEFLSSHTNRRSDSYGGDMTGRMRFILEIVQDIRSAVPDLDIGARISGEDYIPGGILPIDAVLISKALETAGVAYLSVTAGIYDSGAIKHRMMAEGRFFEYARDIRASVSIPVTGVGRIMDIPQAEARLTNGFCDQVAIGRGLVADPDMIPRHLRKESPILCTQCGRCMYLRQGFKDLDCPLRDFPRRVQDNPEDEFS
nr:NADH:flavin oxidoreductase [uncultured Desulfobacter sp.]